MSGLMDKITGGGDDKSASSKQGQDSSTYGGGRMEDDLLMSKENKTKTDSADQVAGREGMGTKMFDKLTGGKSGDGKVASSTAPSDPGAGPTGALPAGNPSGG